MHHVEQMLEANPARASTNRSDGTADCIVACLDCLSVCTSCADACIVEDDVATLGRCIRLNQDCAALCHTTAEVLSRSNEPDWAVIRAVLDACAFACAACSAECEKHAHMKHCEVCAAACRECETACHSVVGRLSVN